LPMRPSDRVPDESRGWACEGMTHLPPFQVSASVTRALPLVYLDPTAVHALAETHDTPWNTPCLADLFALRSTDQAGAAAPADGAALARGASPAGERAAAGE